MFSPKASLINPLVHYIKASIEELRKVAWPTRTETIRYSVLVIGISVGIAFAMGIIDYILTLGIEKIIDLIS